MQFDVGWLGFSCSLLGLVFMGYVWRKSVGNRDFFLEIFTDIVNEATTNEDLQKKLYLAGAIVGNGLKSGLDLPNLLKGGKGGWFRIEDVIGLGIQHFLGNLQGPSQDTGMLESPKSQKSQISRHRETPKM